MLYARGSFQPGPGGGNRRARREGNPKAEALSLLLAKTGYSKNGSRKSKPRGGEERAEKLAFSSLKSGNYLLYLQRRNLPQKEEKSLKVPPSPTVLSAGTNKMTDVPCKSSWGGGRV